MEWRCEWCGKPHEEDAPPCDNCGHGTFERAVVQQPAATAGGSTTVWICTECGREHPKHSPPCSRCGNANLEREEVHFDDVEVERVGYRDLLTTRYALGLVLVALLGGVLVLGLAGVVDLPGIGSGVPEVDGVPGSATELDGVPLADVEAAFVVRLNSLRDQRGRPQLRRTDRLDELATYFNQRRVKALLGDDTHPEPGDLLEHMDEGCGSEVVLGDYSVAVPDSANSAEAIGNRLAARAMENGRGAFGAPRGLTGLDVHAIDDGRVSITQLAC